MSEQRFREQRRKEAAARIWLSYYNRVLYEKGVITERERNRMELKIHSWKMTLT
ncbi:MAG: hypothetical protein HFG02_06170 [Oscillibacter sp.]|nr:hypothetical protein [Oscillibacter sp.]